MATKAAGATDFKNLVGQAVEDLSLTDRLQYANTWIAFRLYSPPHKVTKDGVEYVDVPMPSLRPSASLTASDFLCIASAESSSPRAWYKTPKLL